MVVWSGVNQIIHFFKASIPSSGRYYIHSFLSFRLPSSSDDHWPSLVYYPPCTGTWYSGVKLTSLLAWVPYMTSTSFRFTSDILIQLLHIYLLFLNSCCTFLSLTTAQWRRKKVNFYLFFNNCIIECQHTFAFIHVLSYPTFCPDNFIVFYTIAVKMSMKKVQYLCY